ncbi:hypothetical protein [Methylobacterium nodulans]|uniref:hypothetical protein n=1 Tax=Methylobacterium nodulans TaxID=114616 RepID=UPI0012EE3F0A|nr:hypothetical protein [Methylobacterium nodulans]
MIAAADMDDVCSFFGHLTGTLVLTSRKWDGDWGSRYGYRLPPKDGRHVRHIVSVLCAQCEPDDMVFVLNETTACFRVPSPEQVTGIRAFAVAFPFGEDMAARLKLDDNPQQTLLGLAKEVVLLQMFRALDAGTRPILILDEINGVVYLMWFLKQPISAYDEETKDRYRNVVCRIAQALGGDPGDDPLTATLPVPGTLTLRDNGVHARVWAISLSFDVGPSALEANGATIEDLEAAAERIEKTTPRT